MNVSMTAALLATLPDRQRGRFLGSLTDAEKEELFFLWPFWARPNQLAPKGDWFTWLLLAGRGFGKTRTAGETIRDLATAYPRCRIALTGRTAADVRDTMILGESGIMAISPPWFRPTYSPSKRLLVWPNGSEAHCYSGEEPDLLRGPQHHFAWSDEWASWRYLEDAHSNLLLGLRLGNQPRHIISTTPRPVKQLREVMKSIDTEISTGSTYENLDNLAPAFRKNVVARYEGTRLGRQELHAAVLDDIVGALFTHALIDAARIPDPTHAPTEFRRLVVAIDPATTAGEESDETGIVVAGVAPNPREGGRLDCYILDDLSLRDTPQAWATAAVTAYQKRQADRIIAEVNQGGLMVEHTVRTIDQAVSYKGVHAKVGKRLRAEPVAALYEQGRIHHMGGFATLEDQMCTWVPGDPNSPDRLDALVYAVTELMLGDTTEAGHTESIW